MRLIDADALKDAFKNKEGNDFTAFHFYEAIDKAPTIEPDRPHGEWIQTYESVDGRGADRYKCSFCNHEINIYYKPYRFCPNCGAKMRKEGDEK